MKYKSSVQNANDAIQNISSTTAKLLKQKQITADMVVEHLQKIQRLSDKIDQRIKLEREEF